MPGRIYTRGPLKKRFEAKFIKGSDDECWIWEGAVCDGRYGKIKNGQAAESVHRVAWKLYKGEIPEGLLVCHSCDTPLCVNPDHLWLGTDADNMRDKTEKGRGNSPKGAAHGSAILTEIDVRAIRASAQSNRKLAFLFDTGKSNVSAIKRREIWKHL